MRAFPARSLLRWLCLTVVALTVTAVADAKAQSWDDMLQPHLPRSEFEAAVSDLDLNEEQKAAAWAAFDAFLVDFTREAAVTKAKVDALGAGGEGSWDDLNFDWWDALLRFEARLEDSVKVAIGPDQRALEGWRRAMRDNRRARVVRELHDWQRQRHVYDLLAILQPLSLSHQEQADLADCVQAYASEMDHWLRQYQRDRITLTRGMRNYGEDAMSEKKQREAIDGWLALMKNVPRINDEFAPRIADALEPANRDAFLQAIDRATYPEAFRKCPAELALETIRLAPDVADEKRQAIESLYADYAMQRDQIRRQITAIVRKWEKGEYPLNREMEEFWKSVQGQPAMEWHEQRTELLRQHPANPLLQRRHDLAIEPVRQMRSIFADAEIARLPLAARLCLTAW